MNIHDEQVGIAVYCKVCGARKKPIGRSAPLGVYLCDDDCEGYREEPLPGQLWPGEELNMATKKAKFPTELLVIRETSGGESYLVAHEKAEDVAVVGETVTVARYQYIGDMDVSTVVEVK